MNNIMFGIFMFFATSASAAGNQYLTLDQGNIINLMVDKSEVTFVINYPGMHICGVRFLVSKGVTSEVLDQLSKNLEVTEMNAQRQSQNIGYFRPGLQYESKHSGAYVTYFTVKTVSGGNLKEVLSTTLLINPNSFVGAAAVDCQK